MSEEKMPSRAEEATKLFTYTYSNCLSKLRSILALATLVVRGWQPTAKALAIQNVGLLEEEKELKELVASTGRDPLTLATDMANSTVEEAVKSAEAAMLVFAHSTLESAAMDLCTVTALLAPKDWISVVRKKMLSLEELQQIPDLSNDQALERVLVKHLKQLEKESLLTKIDTVMARCKPDREWFERPGYRYDRVRIDELDEKRHDIVHRDALGIAIPEGQESAEYLVRTGIFLITIVGRRYGLKLDLRYLSFTGNSPTPSK